MVLLLNGGFCNGCITKRVRITQQMCPIMILFQDCFPIKDESNFFLNAFCHFLKNVAFQNLKVQNPFYDAAVTKSTFYVAAPTAYFYD